MLPVALRGQEYKIFPGQEGPGKKEPATPAEGKRKSQSRLKKRRRIRLRFRRMQPWSLRKSRLRKNLRPYLKHKSRMSLFLRGYEGQALCPGGIKGNHKGLPLPNVLIGSGKGFLDETDSMPANFIGGFLFCKGLLAQDYGDALVSGSIADARTLVPILASDSGIRRGLRDDL